MGQPVPIDDLPSAPNVVPEDDLPSSPMKPSPANAGLLNLITSLVGIPTDTVQSALNLGIAGAGRIAGAAGGTPPELLKNSVGTTEWIRNKLRATGMPLLSPDNPTPESMLGTGQYEFVSRGGIIPGGAIPAAGSMIAEKIGGPQWAGVGALAPSAIGMAAKAALPTASPSEGARLLQKEGVQLTPGQQMGGAIKRAEDAATSFPILGDAIKGAQRRGFEQFDTAAFNRALAPIGQKLPSGLKGNQAVEYTYGKLGDAYADLLPNLKGELYGPSGRNVLPMRQGQPAPMSLKQELDGIRTLGQNLPEPQRGQLNRIIENEVERRFTVQGMASGETLKLIEEKLGKMSKSFGQSDNYDIRILGGGVQEIQNALRRMIERVNPAYQGQLAKINEGYANFKTIQNAASNVAAQEGVFSPAQLHRAVRAADRSKDKARFAEGNALMQDLSTAGKNVLPSSVPDSGTPFRAALMYMLANPIKGAALSLPLGAASLPYTSAGQGALQSLLEAEQAKKAVSPVLQNGILQAILSQRQ